MGLKPTTADDATAFLTAVVKAFADGGSAAAQAVAQDMPPTVTARDVARTAVTHRVPGVVHALWSDASETGQSVREALAVDAQAGIVRHMRILATLKRLGPQLDSADIPWLVVKGPVIAGLAYPQPVTRWYGDLDMLVSRRHARQVIELIEADGGRLVDANFELLRDQGLGEIHAVASTGVDVDLHWELVNAERTRSRLRVQASDFLTSRVPCEVSGVPMWSACDVHAFVHLVVHAAMSGGDRLGWLLDVDQWWRSREMDPQDIAWYATTSGCNVPFAWVAHRTGTLLGTPGLAECGQSMVSTPQWATIRAAHRLWQPHATPGQATVVLELTRNPATTMTSSAVAAISRVRGRRKAGVFMFDNSARNPLSAQYDSTDVLTRSEYFSWLETRN